MPGVVVVDASLVVKWLIREEDSDKAHALLQSWKDQGIRLAAPYLMPFEVTNALHQRVIQGELSVAGAGDMVENLLSSGPELHQTAGLHARALELASELRQGASYDAHYLALAEEFGCELWTADRRFHRAAEQAGNVHLIADWVTPQ